MHFSTPDFLQNQVVFRRNFLVASTFTARISGVHVLAYQCMYISFSHTVYEECRKYVKALDMLSYFWEDFDPLVTHVAV